MKTKNPKVKVKTRKSVIKRVKVTGTGKLTHRTNYTGHLRRNKSSKRKRGFKIAYCQNAEVFHPTRKKKDILKKKLRIGYGSIPALINKKKSLLNIIFISIRDLIPPMRIESDKINTKKTASLLLKIYFAKWLGSLYFNFGKLLYIKDVIFQKIKK